MLVFPLLIWVLLSIVSDWGWVGGHYSQLLSPRVPCQEKSVVDSFLLFATVFFGVIFVFFLTCSYTLHHAFKLLLTFLFLWWCHIWIWFVDWVFSSSQGWTLLVTSNCLLVSCYYLSALSYRPLSVFSKPLLSSRTCHPLW